ncbi:PaaI family thioesterase [Histidinibacterium lentulum]|uniref:Medium/long-chain acyl-CoA thioesterase YigI n=1 Tax=Histidinibacterium lentulum TaxID=2480588 RepID=A0A3N2RA87_9RHOB|nr:PaaI family thioesterase [Histidinibacterium lentulum]
MTEALAEPSSAFQEHLGHRLTGWGPGYARFEMAVTPALMNRHGVPHGGVHATILDSAMGYAGVFPGEAEGAERPMSQTLSLSVNYLAPARGSALMAEGRVTGGGRRTYFTEARLWDGAGTLVATATGVFRVRGG